MRETKKCYTIEPDRYQNPELRFEIIDGPTVLHEIREDILRGNHTVEIELTIRYLEEAK